MWALSLMRPAHCNELIKVMKSGYEAWPSLSLRILASSEKCKQNQIVFLQSDPVETFEMFALKLLWCEAWEAAWINSSDEPLRFPGAGNPLASDTLENITLWLEMCKGTLCIKGGKQPRICIHYTFCLWRGQTGFSWSFTFKCIHLADAFILSDLQMRNSAS